jgi:hypothetical protein
MSNTCNTNVTQKKGLEEVMKNLKNILTFSQQIYLDQELV